MGKQIRFIMDEHDESIFFSYIIDNGIVFFAKKNGNPEPITELPDKGSEPGWFKLYLYKESFGAITYAETKGGRRFIDSINAPVIEFRRTIVRENIKEIARGRLWLEMKYYDNETLIRKDKLIDDWYKELGKWIKSNLTSLENGGQKEYVSKSLIDAVKNGYKLLG
jgi:hypothetical protein